VEDLTGLPGFQPVSETVLLTADPCQLRNAHGRALMYPGRSHPLTRRAVSAVRTGRVSAGRGEAISLLLTYTAEVGLVLRKIFALRLRPDGAAAEAEDFLSLVEASVPVDGLWRERFAAWAPAAIVDAASLAEKVASRLGSAAVRACRDRLNDDAAVTSAWLERRANELCGQVVPANGDLFDIDPMGANLRSDPEQRLEAFMADPSNLAAKRHDAAASLSRWRAAGAGRSSPPPVTVRPLGMLMLVP
jgi:hypothetical protein